MYLSFYLSIYLYNDQLLLLSTEQMLIHSWYVHVRMLVQACYSLSYLIHSHRDSGECNSLFQEASADALVCLILHTP